MLCLLAYFRGQSEDNYSFLPIFCRYVNLKPCIARLPEKGYGANITTWPARLHYPPDRLQTLEMDAYISRNELFKAESRFWNDIVGSYVRAYHWKKIRLRNVMDMRAGFGGYCIYAHCLLLTTAWCLRFDVKSWTFSLRYLWNCQLQSSVIFYQNGKAINYMA